MGVKEVKVDGLCVDVKFLVMGMLDNNVYVVSDDEGVFVVDPSGNVDLIIQQLEGRKLDAIVLTHYHWDHVGGAAELARKTGAPVIASEVDAKCIENPTLGYASRTSEPCKVDRCVKMGDVVKVGNMEWKVIETPGHSAGSICLFMIPQFGNHKEGYPVLISGDTLFQGTTGRIDFEDSVPDAMPGSIKRLAMLPDDTVVLPGHNGLTTVGAERPTFARFGWEPEE